MLLYMSADVMILALVHIQANATTATISRQGGVTLNFWRFEEPPRTRVDTEWTSWGISWRRLVPKSLEKHRPLRGVKMVVTTGLQTQLEGMIWIWTVSPGVFVRLRGSNLAARCCKLSTLA
jgi:hypothetical protein